MGFGGHDAGLQEGVVGAERREAPGVAQCGELARLTCGLAAVPTAVAAASSVVAGHSACGGTKAQGRPELHTRRHPAH